MGRGGRSDRLQLRGSVPEASAPFVLDHNPNRASSTSTLAREEASRSGCIDLSIAWSAHADRDAGHEGRKPALAPEQSLMDGINAGRKTILFAL